MIEKNIFFIWINKDYTEIPDLFKYFINTWAKHYKDYNIRLITNNDLNEFDLFGSIIKERLNYVHPAFLSDILRVEIINKYGGLYSDTDIECIKKLDDSIFENNKTLLFEEMKDSNSISSALFGEKSNGDFTNQLIDIIINNNYEIPKGSINGFNTTMSNISNYKMFPSSYFFPFYCMSSPEKIDITDDLHGIHWFSATWAGENHEYFKSFKNNINRLRLERV